MKVFAISGSHGPPWEPIPWLPRGKNGVRPISAAKNDLAIIAFGGPDSPCVRATTPHHRQLDAAP